MVDRVGRLSKIEEERLLAPVAAAVMMPPPPIVDVVETQAQVTGVDGSRPELNRPNPLSQKEMKAGLDEVQHYIDGLQPDELLQKTLTDLIGASTERLVLVKERVERERELMNLDGEKRITAIDSHQKSIDKQGSVGNVAKSLTSLSLVATGAASIAITGPTIIAAGAVVCGSVLLVDQIFDSKAQRIIASWIGKGNQESEEKWLNRIQMGMLVTSSLISLGLSPSHAIQLAIGITKAAVTTTKGITDYRVNNQRALLIELDAACRESEKEVDLAMNDLQQLCDTIHTYHESMHQMERARAMVADQLLRTEHL